MRHFGNFKQAHIIAGFTATIHFVSYSQQKFQLSLYFPVTLTQFDCLMKIGLHTKHLNRKVKGMNTILHLPFYPRENFPSSTKSILHFTQ